MRKKNNVFMTLGLSETEAYALLNAVATVLVSEQEKSKEEQRGNNLRFENFANGLYIRALSAVFTELEASVRDESSTE